MVYTQFLKQKLSHELHFLNPDFRSQDEYRALSVSIDRQTILTNAQLLINYNRAWLRSQYRNREQIQWQLAIERRGPEPFAWCVDPRAQIQRCSHLFKSRYINPSLSLTVCLLCTMTPCQCRLKTPTKIFGMFKDFDENDLFLNNRDFLAMHMENIATIWHYNEANLEHRRRLVQKRLHKRVDGWCKNITLISEKIRAGTCVVSHVLTLFSPTLRLMQCLSYQL